MAGLDPREHPFGAGVNEKPSLSKAGSRYLMIASVLIEPFLQSLD